MIFEGGYTGKVLRVDLTTREITTEELDDDIALDFIGGRGLGARILWDEVPANVKALDVENRMIFLTGPLTGTSFPSAARAVIVTRSPLTTGYLYSVAGGGFGHFLKRAGYDVLVIQGRAESPCYIRIVPEETRILDATHLWGMETTKAAFYIDQAYSKHVYSALIGPAGENLVPLAGVMTSDGRQFGRGGAGAVMGSKNLKAVAVWGDVRPKIADEHRFKKVISTVNGFLREKPGSGDGFPIYGTGESVESSSALGFLPTRNFSETTFERAADICTVTMMDKGLMVRREGCYGCPVRCSNMNVIKSGPYAGTVNRGLEYENLFALGSACGIGNPEAVIRANMICDELGLDTMSAGVAVAFAMECFEKGLISRNDAGGLDLRFGQEGAALRFIEDMAYGRGLGKIIGQGVRTASSLIGGESYKFAMHVKGLEMGGYDPRGAKGQAIVFAAGNRGACHHSIGLTARKEIKEGTRFQVEGKGKMVKSSATGRIVQDSACNCTLAFTRSYDTEVWAEGLSALTGLDFLPDAVNACGQRINTLERLYNLRCGFTRKDDTLPPRLMEEEVPDGPAMGQVLTRAQLDNLLSQYYEEMGWDALTGVPTRDCLKTLGLDSLV